MLQDFLKVLMRAIIAAIIIVIAIIILVRVLARAPGIIIALSILAIGVLSVAFYKGSFSAVGLHTRKSIRFAIIVSVVLLILSSMILIFGFGL